MLEGKMFLVLSLLSTIEASITNHPFSRFEKTNIIDNKCDKSWFFETVPSSNVFDCGLKCNQVKDCRRFLFCGGKSECKLYGDGTDCIINGDATGCHCFRKLIGCNGTQCTCPWGLYGYSCEHVVEDCQDAFSRGIESKRSVVTRIKPVSAREAFDVWCWLDDTSAVSILNRFWRCNREDFNRTFREYEQGFGIVPWNNWLGLDKTLHILKSQQPFELHIHFVNSQWDVCSIYYHNFTLGNASSKYQFQTTANYYSVGRATCGDSLTGSNNTLDLRGRPFSTYDQDGTSTNCAARFGGGWWFADNRNCSDGLLTATEYDENFWNDIFWEPGMRYLNMKLVHNT